MVKLQKGMKLYMRRKIHIVYGDKSRLDETDLDEITIRSIGAKNITAINNDGMEIKIKASDMDMKGYKKFFYTIEDYLDYCDKFKGSVVL